MYYVIFMQAFQKYVINKKNLKNKNKIYFNKSKKQK